LIFQDNGKAADDDHGKSFRVRLLIDFVRAFSEYSGSPEIE